jgi:hypothetical protein
MADGSKLEEKKQVSEVKDDGKGTSSSSEDVDPKKKIAYPNPEVAIRKIRPKQRQYTEQQLSSSSEEENLTLSSKKRVVPYKVKYYKSKARKSVSSSSSESESSDSVSESSESSDDAPPSRKGVVVGGYAEQIFNNIFKKNKRR